MSTPTLPKNADEALKLYQQAEFESDGICEFDNGMVLLKQPDNNIVEFIVDPESEDTEIVFYELRMVRAHTHPNFPKNALEALTIITNSKFDPFTEAEEMMFGGVTSDEPEVCWQHDEKFVIVHDGADYEFIETASDEMDHDPRVAHYTFMEVMRHRG